MDDFLWLAHVVRNAQLTSEERYRLVATLAEVLGRRTQFDTCSLFDAVQWMKAAIPKPPPAAY